MPSCKTPHRVRNEFLMHLIGHTHIRRVMTVAAFESYTELWNTDNE